MHDGCEADVDGDWVNEDDAAVGEGGGGLGQKTKEAAVSEDRGDPTQIPKEACFCDRALHERKEAGTMPSAARGAASPWFLVRAKKPEVEEVSISLLSTTLPLYQTDQGQTNRLTKTRY